jgi:long-subunit fatty acid transport protein
LGGNDHWGVWDSQDWLTVLGYNSFLVNETSTGRYSTAIPENIAVSNDLFVEEKGAIDSYDFSIGTSISDVVNIGATVSMTDINYRLYSQYTEYMLDGSGDIADNRRFDLYNWDRTDGAGWQVKAGIIVKPVEELRIGLSYHSPTWYNMTDHFAADLSHNLSGVQGANLDANYARGEVLSYNGEEDAVYDYKFRTPDKWTVSLAAIIASKAIVSADYELTNYKNNMRLHDRNGKNLSPDPNEYIKTDFRMSSALRVGIEYRFTSKFLGRVGYSWVQSPFTTDIKTNGNEVTTDPRSVTQYAFDGDTHYITYGLGYQFIPQRRSDDRSVSYFYTDIAFVMKSQKDDLYAFTGADKATLKTNAFQGLLTVGYKF